MHHEGEELRISPRGDGTWLFPQSTLKLTTFRADKKNMCSPRHLGLLSRACAVAVLASTQATPQDVKALADMTLTELADIPIVSAARHEQSRFGSPRAVSVITAEEIRRRNLRNVPEAVGTLAGVFLQQTNYGGGSPIVRGMVGNRILLMVNGIRINNGTYRLGPNQYLATIDINQVDRIEVVRGAGSVLYGSDAFGAVINILTKTAPDPRNGAERSGVAAVRFSSADRSGAGRLEGSGTWGRVGLLAGYTQESFGDLRAGGGRGVQRFTGYDTRAADLNLTWSPSDKSALTASLTTLRQHDLDRTDVLAGSTDLEYLWNPQGRHLASVQYTRSGISRYISAVQFSLAYQRPFESVTRIAVADPGTRRHSRDIVHTAEAGVELTSAIGNAHVLTYGFTGTHDWVDSTRTDVNLRTGIHNPRIGNYPNGSRYANFGIFLQDEVRVFSQLDVVIGVRHDWFRLNVDVNDPLAGIWNVRSTPSALTGSAHFLYKLTRHVSAVGGVSQGFRAPNVDDSSVLGGTGSRFEIPGTHLKPERSTNLEYGVRVQGRAGHLSLVAFEDRYRDMIDRVPALFRGLPFRDFNENGIRDPGDLEVLQRQNINRAAVRGFEMEAILNVAEGWTWTQTVTWTRGTDRTLQQPLTRIPPLNGTSRLTWQPHGSLWVEGVFVAAADQHRLAAGDKTDVRIGPGGTPGYKVIHLRAGLRRSALAGLSVALENLTNRQYRFHGSGFDRPGVNLVLGYTRLF